MRHDPTPELDAIVVGAGFAGLYMLHRLRRQALRVQVLEAGDDVGGTWYWNCYPGARCDVESLQYSYSFDEELQQEWVWTERYAKQGEILAYIHHVADRFDLRRDIRLNTRVVAGAFDADANRWTVTTDGGDTLSARFLVSAVGCLSASRVPDIPGRDSFRGGSFHTGTWPKEGVDFTGLKVAVIGTGSSGIQAIPRIAEQAAELTVFQRTPNFSVPAWNRPLTDAEQIAWKAHYPEHRDKARTTRSGILYDYSQRATGDVGEEERQAEYARRWLRGGANFTHAFNDVFIRRESNDQLAEFVRGKIRQTVHDPAVADRLVPKDHAIGTKRICVDTDYYQTFNRPNVRLVDLRETPIEAIVPEGIRTTDATRAFDAIVFATGYDAVTGSVERLGLVGPDGVSLKQRWSAGPATYLGIMVAGLPNLFLVTGPGSPSVLTNVIVSIEHHVDWIARCLDTMRAEGVDRIEADAEAQAQWVAHVNQVADATLFPSTASWYMGANIPGKPRVFLPYVGGFGSYARICEEAVADGYRGFVFSDAVDDGAASSTATATATATDQENAR